MNMNRTQDPPPAPREEPGRALLEALWRGRLTVVAVFLLVTGA